MIAHPAIFFDNTPRRKDSMWKKFLAWLVKLMPGVVETIMTEKAKEAAKKPKPKPTDTSNI